MTDPLEGVPIASGRSEQFKLADLIPGLAHGILGMQKGEIREIYIHPAYGYGHQSHFKKGLGLKARVELLAIRDQAPNKSNFRKLAALAPVDSEPVLSNPAEVNDLRLKAAYAEGYVAGSFYRLGTDFYSIDRVIENVYQLTGKRIDLDASDQILDDLFTVLFQRFIAS